MSNPWAASQKKNETANQRKRERKKSVVKTAKGMFPNERKRRGCQSRVRGNSPNQRELREREIEVGKTRRPRRTFFCSRPIILGDDTRKREVKSESTSRRGGGDEEATELTIKRLVQPRGRGVGFASKGALRKVGKRGKYKLRGFLFVVGANSASSTYPFKGRWGWNRGGRKKQRYSGRTERNFQL